ncbi:MAG: hypothetical protein ACI9WV_001436, partial [Patiriisocius sp.]
FFFSKNFFKKFNGIRILRNDDRSEVGMCVKLNLNHFVSLLLYN